MPAKFACADFTFPLLQLIAMLEFDGVDIGLFENRSHLWPSCEFQNVGASARQLKQKLDDCGLQAADIFLQMDPDFAPYAVNRLTRPAAKRRATGSSKRLTTPPNVAAGM
jgi:hypothetical protein